MKTESSASGRVKERTGSVMSCKEMRKGLCLAVSLVIFFAGHGGASGYETSYTGKPSNVLSISVPITVTCRADYAAPTGYYRDGQKGWTVSSSFEKQRTTVTWIITIDGNRGRVTDGQGNVGTYLVTKRDATGVILVEAVENVSIQVISIHPSNSSFVYTTQNANPVWNRASTFTGACE